MRISEIFDWYFASLGVSPRDELDIAAGVSTRPDDPIRVIVAPSVMDALTHVKEVAQAYLRREPLLLITIEGELKSYGCGEHIDLLEIMEAITKYNTLVSHSEQAEIKLTGAIASSLTSRLPAHMIVPIDLLSAEISTPQLWPILERHGRGIVPVTRYNWPRQTENA